MRELSEKELEIEYKNEKLIEIPDMWEDIEGKLAPKKKKRVIPYGRIAAMAAAVIVMLVLGPVMYYMQQGGDKSMNNSYDQEGVYDTYSDTCSDAITGDDSLECDEDNEEESNIKGSATENDCTTEESDASQNTLQTGKTESENAGNGNTQSQGTQNTDTNENTDTSGSETVLQIELKVQVQKVENTEGGLLILATVLEGQNSNSQAGSEQNSIFQDGDEISILYEYDEKDYEKADFSGILRVSCEKTDEKIKLLEILP